MGADFKAKAKRTFEKCWDKAAVEANTPDLFKKNTDCMPKCFEAEPIGSRTLSVGDCAVVRLEEGQFIGRQGLSPVLIISGPTPQLKQSIIDSSKVARADVVAVDPISGTYEVSLS